MPAPAYRGAQPSCFDRVKFGFGIGLFVGLSSGLLFGGFQGLRLGLRGFELMQSTGKTMMVSGGTFGTFMAIGTAIRC